MSLSTGLFGKLPYYPALLPDSNNIASWTSGGAASTVFDYENLATTGTLIRLRNLQCKNPASYPTAISLAADNYQANSVDASAINNAGLLGAWLETYGATAAQNRLMLTALNSTGSTITNQWFSWGIQVEEPNIAQRQQFPGAFGDLTADEEALATKYASGSRGVLPRTLDWVIANEYKTQIVDAAVLGQNIAAGTSTQTYAQDSVKAGEILVLAGLWCSPGAGTDGLAVTIGVDNNASLYTISAYGLGTGTMQPAFIQARQQIVLTAQANSSVSNVTVAGVFWHVRLTDEILARVGTPAELAQLQKTAPGTLDKVTVGVL